MRLTASLGAALLLILQSGATTGARPQTAQRPGFPTAAADTGIPPDQGIVQGRVVDARSGAPIAQAIVSLSSAGRMVTTTTDADGRYARATPTNVSGEGHTDARPLWSLIIGLLSR